MEFYYMVNYSFKYLELLDTVFLALKKKPLGEYLPAHLLNLNLMIVSLLARLSPLRYRPALLLSAWWKN